MAVIDTIVECREYECLYHRPTTVGGVKSVEDMLAVEWMAVPKHTIHFGTTPASARPSLRHKGGPFRSPIDGVTSGLRRGEGVRCGTVTGKGGAYARRGNGRNEFIWEER